MLSAQSGCFFPENAFYFVAESLKAFLRAGLWLDQSFERREVALRAAVWLLALLSDSQLKPRIEDGSDRWSLKNAELLGPRVAYALGVCTPGQRGQRSVSV